MSETADIAKSLKKILDRGDTDATLTMIADLLETLTMAIEKIGEGNEKSLKSTNATTDKIAEAISKLSSLTKTPQVTVQVDMDGINRTNQLIVKAIEQLQFQQKTLTDAIRKLIPQDHSQNWQALYNMIENSNKLMLSLQKPVISTESKKRSHEVIIDRDGAMRMNKVTINEL